MRWHKFSFQLLISFDKLPLSPPPLKVVMVLRLYHGMENGRAGRRFSIHVRHFLLYMFSLRIDEEGSRVRYGWAGVMMGSFILNNWKWKWVKWGGKNFFFLWKCRQKKMLEMENVLMLKEGNSAPEKKCFSFYILNNIWYSVFFVIEMRIMCFLFLFFSFQNFGDFFCWLMFFSPQWVDEWLRSLRFHRLNRWIECGRTEIPYPSHIWWFVLKWCGE